MRLPTPSSVSSSNSPSSRKAKGPPSLSASSLLLGALLPAAQPHFSPSHNSLPRSLLVRPPLPAHLSGRLTDSPPSLRILLRSAACSTLPAACRR